MWFDFCWYSLETASRSRSLRRREKWLRIFGEKHRIVSSAKPGATGSCAYAQIQLSACADARFTQVLVTCRESGLKAMFGAGRSNCPLAIVHKPN